MVSRNTHPKSTNQSIIDAWEGDIDSTTGKSRYHAKFEGDVAFCNCKYGKQHPEGMVGRAKWCRHVILMVSDLQERVNEFLRTRLEDRCEGDNHWGDFGTIVQVVTSSRTRESNMIRTAAFAQCLVRGHFTADDIHDLVGHTIEGDPRIIGATIGGMKQGGWIIDAGKYNSQRTGVNHGRHLRKFVLSGKAKTMLAARIHERAPAWKL